jgi:hypothetical protein
MITVRLTRDKVFKWYYADDVWAKGYCFAPDGKLYRNADLCFYFSPIANEVDFREKLLLANGKFSIIIHMDNLL